MSLHCPHCGEPIDFVTTAEVLAMGKVRNRRTLQNWRARKSPPLFPEPLADLPRLGPVWDRAAVRTFLRAHRAL